MRIGNLLVVLFPLVCNVGCLSPAALGTMETTGNEAPVVLDHFGRGQGEGFFVAEYDDGFLRIELPRANIEEVRVIEVKKDDER